MTIIEKKFEVGGRQVTLQTGLLAKQTRSSVLVDVDGTTILVTICTKDITEDKGFFPFSKQKSIKLISMISTEGFSYFKTLI